MPNGPLSNYRLLDLTDERGLLAGRMFADLGADVVTIEPPGGSPARRVGPFAGDEPGLDASLFWRAYSRGKRSLILDLATESGRARLRELARQADFLFESFEPGYLEGLGLGYHELSRLNPRLIVASISPFGQTGPKARWAASDIIALAASGALLLTGDPDRPPLRVSVPQAFLHASADAAAGALVAHHARLRDGLGQHVDASAQASTMLATMFMVLQEAWGEKPASRVGGGLKVGGIPIRFVHPCKDGHVSITLLFGTAMGPFTQRLMTWLHEEGFVDAATRDKDWLGYAALLESGAEPVAELQRCVDAISRFTMAHTKGELLAGALERAVLMVPVNTAADLFHSPQLAERDYWAGLEADEGTVFPGPFAKFSASPIAHGRPAPVLANAMPEDGAAWTKDVPRPAESSQAPADDTPALAGLKVVDFAWVLAGPAGSRYLSDYGATVVHIETQTRIDAGRTFQPFKDGVYGLERSGIYASANAGKLGVTLNLARPEAREVAKKLAVWADVITESFSPGAMAAWGLGYEDLRKLNPGLIMLSTCLNGQYGPYSRLAGFGTMGAQLAGFGALTGWPDRTPTGPYGAYTDYITPKFVAFSILAALDHRQRTGEGQYIDLSQVEASLHFLAPALLDYAVNGRVQSGRGNASEEMAPHGVYPCVGGDRWIAVATRDEDDWQRLCRLSRQGWEQDARFGSLASRLENREALDEQLARWTAGFRVEELEAALQSVRIPAHRAANSNDALSDEQLRFRRHFVEVDHPEMGRVLLESSRLRLSRTPAVPLAAPALIGEHNEQVLREILGLSSDELVELLISGALE